MTFDMVMGTLQRLNVSVEAMAALGAVLRARAEGLELAPEVAPILAEVAALVGVGEAEVEGLPAAQLRAAAGFAQSFLRQAEDLVAAPDRGPGWAYDDPVVLQSQGRGSMLVAGVIARIAPSLDGLDARLRADGARFLDIGSGVGLLAAAMCQEFPALTCVGVDPWPPAQELAARNLAELGLTERVERREHAAADLADEEAFDLAWVAAPFIGREDLGQALAVTHRALRPGGWAVVGRFTAPPEPLPQLLNRLRVVRWGGHPWAADELVALVGEAGLAQAHLVERTWSAPVDIVAGRR